MIFKKKINNPKMICSFLLLLYAPLNVAFVTFVPSSQRRIHSSTSNIAGQKGFCSQVNSQKAKNMELCNEIMDEIKLVAQELWGGNEIPVLPDSALDESLDSSVVEGEAHLGDGVTFKDRADYFRKDALKGCPKSQHSYGLLLWSGFGGVQKDAKASAKFHAAAASQKHLDGMSVLGGCLRTGTGVKQNVSLGLKIIDYCASVGNPTGVNKKAALLESNQDDFGAVRCYEDCLESDRVNALLLFNLGWCYISGQGVNKKDRDKGISLWKSAAGRAPDEGSEEAGWYLYQEYKRDDPKEANRWLDLAEDLGFEE